MIFKDKKDKKIMELRNTTILIGENGVGKTTIINKLMKSKIVNENNFDEDIEVLFAGLENVKDDIDTSKAKYKEFSKNFNQELIN